MRYFTRGWACGELSDDETERARLAYWSRIDEIAQLLPPAVHRLAREVRLHDGLLEQVAWNPGSRQLRLTLVCEDAHGTTVQA